MLSDVTIPRCPARQWFTVFVELPSQLYEHWQEQPQVLRAYLPHYQRRAAVGRSPEAFPPRANSTRVCHGGIVLLGADRSGFTPSASRDGRMLRALNAPSWKKSACPRNLATARPQQFASSFRAITNAAGYYSYKCGGGEWTPTRWRFRGSAHLDPANRQRLHDDIYSSGDSSDPEEPISRSAAREPSPDALLRRRGPVGNAEAA